MDHAGACRVRDPTRSTAEIADRIGSVVRSALVRADPDASVDVIDIALSSPQAPSGRVALVRPSMTPVVLGHVVYMGRWLASARRFVENPDIGTAEPPDMDVLQWTRR